MAYTELDFTKNGNIQTQLIAQFPTGQYNPSDPGQYNNPNITFQTPFNISTDANNNNFYAFGVGNNAGAQDVFGQLNLANVSDVYALLTAYHPGTGTIGTFEFVGTDTSGNALEQDVPLVGGSDIRDFYQGGFANTVNGTTTQNAFEAQNVQGAAGTGNTSTGLFGTYHIDEADFHFATPFATLNHIYLVSNSNDNVVLLGATAQVCFVSGTLMRTTRGDIAVEHLAVGDVAITRDGRRKPIRWLGHRAARCDRHPDPRKVWPVRVAAGAFGEGLPYADLWLSPGHAVCIDDVLVPIRCLVDGERIVQVEMEEVTYWHVEVAGHDVLLANGLPAESYLDTGNRRGFDNAEARSLHFDEDPAPGYDGSGYCLEMVESGPRLSAIRTRLARIGAYATPAESSVHLVVDGVVLRPLKISEDMLQVVVPAGASDVRLVSSAFAPGGDDVRRLGVIVSGLWKSNGACWIEIGLEDPGLVAGFHDIECEAGRPWRWTDGDGHLSPRLWAGLDGDVLLRISGMFEGFSGDDGEARAAA